VKTIKYYIKILPFLLFLLSINESFAQNRTELDSLLNLLNPEIKDTNQIKLQLKIGYKYEFLNVDSALFFYQNVINLADKLDQKNPNILLLKAKATNFIGYVYKTKINYKLAISYLTEAIEIYSFINNKKQVGACYHTIGSIYSKSGKFDKALSSFNKAKYIFYEINYKYGIVATLTNLGIIQNEQGNFDDAIALYLEAVSIAEEINDSQSVAIGNANIASIYYVQQNYSKAINYNTEALKIYKALNYEQGKIPIYTNLGLCYLDLNKYNKALAYVDSSLSISTKINDKRSIGYSYNAKGEIYLAQNEIEKGLVNFKKAYHIRENLQDKNGIGITALNLANCYTKMKDYKKAEYYLILSNQIAIELNSSSMLSDTYKYYKLLFEAQNNYKKAYLYFNKERTISDSIYSAKKHQQIAELETKYQSEKKDREIETLQKDNEIKNQRVLAQRRLILLIGMGSLLLIFAALIFYKWYRTKQKNKQNQLIINNLLSEQKLLRSQMNPHFIYNSLNSIQAFISSGDSYQAEKYLSRFAKLMRGILDNSRADFITLDKEIEVLNLYLELEKLRFEKRFSYSIEVDEALESDFVSLPPMLLQPFVENAILHAFPNQNGGKIKISFSEKNEALLCTVDDNGIGRKAAAENQKAKKHKSLATKITEERLDTLSNQLNKKAQFTIEDKYDENNIVAGTKVTIEIPYIEV